MPMSWELTAVTGRCRGPARALVTCPGGKAGVTDSLRMGIHRAIRQHRSEEKHHMLSRQQG